MPLSNFFVIKDPVHGTMQFSAPDYTWIKSFIDSPHFQRLRHIKQLGMGDLIFPGAVHTRFNHSLGCAFVASQIANKIDLSAEDRQLVIIAGLLHDIGHGPFSHAFEDVIHDKLIRHEDWTPLFLKDYRNEDFYQRYSEENSFYPLCDKKFKMIQDMIMHKSTGKRVLADIVSSQLDADRLDYLLRDSHFCGVTYGEFDFSWMLNCMTIIKSPHGERLGITHKGIGTVEHYLMARRLMIRNIYHLQKKLALEFFMVQLLQTLAENIEDIPAFSEIKHLRLGKFLVNANAFNQAVISSDSTDTLKKKFLEKNYSLYKELCDYDIFMVIRILSDMNEKHPASRLAQCIQQRKIPKIIRLDQSDYSTLESIINEFKQTHQSEYQSWQINLIQTPSHSYKSEADPIYVVNEDNSVLPITETSFMIKAISGRPETTTFLCLDQEIQHDKKIQNLIKKLNTLKQVCV